MNTPTLDILATHMDLPATGHEHAADTAGSQANALVVISENPDRTATQPADEPRDQAPRISRRSLAGLLGVLGLGALGVPAQAAATEVLPTCTMRLHLVFDEPRRSVAMTARVIQTAAGWQLQGLFSPVTEEVAVVPLNATASGEFAQLLVAALASEEPDPGLALQAAVAGAMRTWKATLDRVLA